MRNLLVALAICAASSLGAAELPGPIESHLSSTPQALAEQGLIDQLIVSPAGDLIAWDIETGRGFVLGEQPDAAGVREFRGPPGPQMAVSPGGRHAFLTDVNRRVEIHLPDGSRQQLDLEQQIGAIAWLDDRRLAVSPANGDHRVEIRDVETGDLLLGIEETPRISEEPGYRLLRTTTLAWDPERRRLHTLDSFTGQSRVYDLSKPTAGPLIEARIEDRSKGAYEERIARIDRQLAEQGEFQGASIWRFSTALDSRGTAWMVEGCELAGGDTASPAGTARVLAVDPEGAEYRVAVATPCCSLAAVPWGAVLAFTQPPRPERGGCFATVPRPGLGPPAAGSAWLEVTPLSPRPGLRSRQDPYSPSVLHRPGPAADPGALLLQVALRDPGLALVCTGGQRRPLDCRQLWLDPETLRKEDLATWGRSGRPVTGRVTLEGVAVAGASVALVPADLRTTRLLTLPLALPEEAREPIREVTTDVDGRFTLPALAPGAYRLLLALPGGRTDQSTTFLVAEPSRPGSQGTGPPLDLGAIDFPAGLRLEVVVAGPDGRPIAAAEAGAAQQARAGTDRATTPAGATLYRTSAGEDGRAVIDGLAPDLSVVVTCRAPGHDGWHETFDAPPSFVACTLDPLARITGHVVDEEGEPLPGAQVTLTGSSASFVGAVETATADDQGHFHFDDLEPGSFRVVAAIPGRTARARSLTLEPGDARDVGELVLEPGARWMIWVVDGAQGEPVAGAVLTVVSPPGTLLPGTTNARGEVELEGPASGPLTLEVRAEGFAPRRLDVPESVRTLGGEPHEIVLERGGWIVAHVWDDSAAAPCAGCRIGLSGRGPGQSLVTDGSGTARSEPLAPGVWHASLTRLQGYGLVVTRSGGDDVRTVTVTPDTTVEVRFGDPDETLEVVLSPTPAEPAAWHLVVRDAAGATRLHPLDPSGSATIHRPTGGAVLSLMGGGMTIDIGSLSEDAGDPTLIERPSGLLTGRLPSNADAAGPLWLELVDLATGRRAAEIEAMAGAEFRIPFLPAGVYELRNGDRSFATAAVSDGQETALGELE